MSTPPSMQWRWRTAVAVFAMMAAGTVSPCGLEDPASAAVQRGLMNLVYPQSAYVRTAVWQAQMAGELPRDTLAQRVNLSSQARGTMQLLQATAVLKALAARLDASRVGLERPNVTVVLMGPMLWSRLVSEESGLATQIHVQGPERGDVVLVTDTPALMAVVQAGMRVEQAIDLGLMRFYGPPVQVDALQAWLKAS